MIDINKIWMVGSIILDNILGEVGKTYTIVEINCDVGYSCGNYITHTMIEGTNTVTFTNTLNPTNKGWLKSNSRNKNIFGEVQ